jgi:hypothetical protein
MQPRGPKQVRERALGEHEGDVLLPGAVDKRDEAQRAVLVAESHRTTYEEPRTPSDRRAVTDRVHPREIVDEACCVHDLEVRAQPRWHERLAEVELAKTSTSVVAANDLENLEPRGQAADLASEILCRKALGAEAFWQSVRGRKHVEPRVHELAEQPGDEHGIARVIELELVNDEEGELHEKVSRPLQPEHADDRGEIPKGGEARVLTHRADRCRRKVALANTVGAVQVEPPARLDPPPTPPAAAIGSPSQRHHPGFHGVASPRQRLRGGQVGRKRRFPQDARYGELLEQRCWLGRRSGPAEELLHGAPC